MLLAKLEASVCGNLISGYVDSTLELLYQYMWENCTSTLGKSVCLVPPWKRSANLWMSPVHTQAIVVVCSCSLPDQEVWPWTFHSVCDIGLRLDKHLIFSLEQLLAAWEIPYY